MYFMAVCFFLLNFCVFFYLLKSARIFARPTVQFARRARLHGEPNQRDSLNVLCLCANSNLFSKSRIVLARLARLGSHSERGAPTRRAFQKSRLEVDFVDTKSTKKTQKFLRYL
jgi:hypothetical protein